jgi:hypothetical protein
MTDGLEHDLAVRLRALGDAVPDEFDAPAELEVRVRRRRRTRRRRAGAAGVAVAVVVGAGVIVAAAMSAPPSRPSVNVAEPGRVTADQIDPSVVLLDAKGRFVVGLDAGGHQRETLVATQNGDVAEAQVTADHTTIWYLTVSGAPGTDCGNVVRADVTTGASRVMFRAVAFAINPAGTRVALSGAGDLSQGRCTTSSTGARLSIVDLTRADVVSAPVMRPPTALRWSADGATIAAQTCASTSCSVSTYQSADATRIATMTNAAEPMFSADALYVTRRGADRTASVLRTNAHLRIGTTIYSAPVTSLAALPTTAALFVSGASVDSASILLSLGPGAGGSTIATPVRAGLTGSLMPVPALP